MSKVRIGAVGLLALLISGCMIPISYQKVAETTQVNPKTGQLERVTTWKYADGVTAMTTDPITSSGNDRRSVPPEREFDFGEDM